MSAALQSGLDVYLVAPFGEYDEEIKKLGVKHIGIPVKRTLDPVGDIKLCYCLYKIFRDNKFDIIHNFSVKPNIYGTIAARCSGSGYTVMSVTGLGNVFMDEMGIIFRCIRPLVKTLYWVAFKYARKVWFQNPDDAQFFMESGMLREEKAVIIRGSGVDTNLFSESSVDLNSIGVLKKQLGISDSDIVIIMVSRALKSKGVEDFVDASRVLAKKLPSVKFLFVGDAEVGNHHSVSKEYMESTQSKNLIWLGWRKDVKELLYLSDLAVLPSRYREGVPKALLEAMAMGKPVVATDVPGCREVILSGKNGYLIPTNNPNALSEAIYKIVEGMGVLAQFGEFSRKLAVECFDLTKINKQIITELYEWN